jgi:hypothetical protein
MLHTANGRIFVILLLLTGLAVLCPLYAQQPVNPELGVYPDDDEFGETPEQYIGDTVVIGGIVQQVSPLIIKIETTQGPREIMIVDTALRPEVGDKVRVFGILTATGTVRSLNGFVVPHGLDDGIRGAFHFLPDCGYSLGSSDTGQSIGHGFGSSVETHQSH